MLGVSFSTTREGTDAASVQAGLKQALDAALAEARKVAKPGQVDVQTGSFALYPRNDPRTGKLNGWQGSAELIVEGRDASAIAQQLGRPDDGLDDELGRGRARHHPGQRSDQAARNLRRVP